MSIKAYGHKGQLCGHYYTGPFPPVSKDMIHGSYYPVTCDWCNGQGSFEYQEYGIIVRTPCSKCKGKGKV